MTLEYRRARSKGLLMARSDSQAIAIPWFGGPAMCD
jgi:hypothetical protein